MHLIKEGLVQQNRLCAIGSSAGGLLVGAVINMLPDLFSAAVLKVVNGFISHWFAVPTYASGNNHFVWVLFYH
jgi:predicted peptidase